MAVLRITDKDVNLNNIDYIEGSLKQAFLQAECHSQKRQLGARAVLDIECPSNYGEVIRGELYDKIADVLTVNYKYSYFKKFVKPKGLTDIENEILITALIAADIEEDKRYAFGRLGNLNEIAIDGIYNFRLKPLKEKWEEVISYIPQVFLGEQLKEFISYLTDGKRRRVYVDGEKVYDMHFRRLRRSELISPDDCKILKEIILSGCGEVELNSKLPEADEYYLKEYFGNRVTFSKGYFS